MEEQTSLNSKPIICYLIHYFLLFRKCFLGKNRDACLKIKALDLTLWLKGQSVGKEKGTRATECSHTTCFSAEPTTVH